MQKKINNRKYTKQKKSFIEPRMDKDEYLSNFTVSRTLAVVVGVVVGVRAIRAAL